MSLGLALTNNLHSPLEDQLKKNIEDESGFKMSGHKKMGGPMMIAGRSEHAHPVHEAQACPNEALVKVYEVAAIQITMVLNRWGRSGSGCVHGCLT